MLKLHSVFSAVIEEMEQEKSQDWFEWQQFCLMKRDWRISSWQSEQGYVQIS